MNIEVEIKVKVNNPDKARKKIKTIGKLIKKIYQIDTYYSPPNKEFYKKNEFCEEYLRTREENNKLSFEYHRAIMKNGHKTHTEEYETFVEKPKILKEILDFLNFKKRTIIIKKREIYDCDDFEVILDDVKNLGFFIEVEAKNNKLKREDCMSFLKKLNIKYKKLPEKGYPELMLFGIK